MVTILEHHGEPNTMVNRVFVATSMSYVGAVFGITGRLQQELKETNSEHVTL